jgi:hypothetical protein
MDCPDHSVRAASPRVFTAAIWLCVNPGVKTKLLLYGYMAGESNLKNYKFTFISCQQRKCCAMRVKREVERASEGCWSGGGNFDFVNTMLRAVPRWWRLRSEFCNIIRLLASMALESGAATLRRHMVRTQGSTRSMTLIARARSPSYIRIAFLGALVGSA